MSQELDHIWTQVRGQLALLVDDATFRIWLEPLRALELTDDTLVVCAPRPARRWTAERFGSVLAASIDLVLGGDVRVEIVDARETSSTQRPRRSATPSAKPTPASREAEHVERDTIANLRNPRLTFDHFVIGDNNRLAHAAALAVAEMPAHAYNPLFICGPPGVGKTHLLSAIANLLLAHNPGLTVRSTTGESFTTAFLQALTNGRTEMFKSRFRSVDVLLVDDVHFLERKHTTEEEFFHTFNALHDSGRQLVLTSDRPPRDLAALEDRLRERFQAGLVADITAPDLATRLAILRKRAHEDGIELADGDALTLLAERVRTNVRNLEGALVRVVAYSSLTGKPITPELAAKVIDGLYPGAQRQSERRTVADVQAATCELFGLSREELLSANRSPRLAWPRQLAMYLSRELTDESLPAIGRHFGGRDHTTVMHACKRAAARVAADEDARSAVEKLQLELARE